TCSGLRNLNNRGRRHSVGLALHFPRRSGATWAEPTFCPIVRDALRQARVPPANVTSGAAVARCPRAARSAVPSLRRRKSPLNAETIEEARIGRHGRGVRYSLVGLSSS